MRFDGVMLVSCVNFLLNFAVESSLIYLPLFGQQLGASDFQVGLVGAVYGGAYLISSLYCGRQSDRWGKTGFIRFGLFLCGIAFAAQLLVHNLFVLMAIRAGVGLALGVSTAALVAYAFELKADMGRFSSYGSLGWIAGALVAVWVTEISYLFVISILCCGMAFFFSHYFPKPQNPVSVLKRVDSPDLGRVLKRGFAIYLGIFFRHLGAAAVWVIFPLYFTSQGMERSWVGLMWVINFFVQFVVMRYLERFNPYRIFTLGQVLSIVVFIIYALTLNLVILMGVQVLLGMAWACLYVGALLIVLRSGEERGTASGIFQATLNLSNVVGPFLGGVIAQYRGYHGVMVFAAVLGVAGLGVAAPKKKRVKTKNSDQTVKGLP